MAIKYKCMDLILLKVRLKGTGSSETKISLPPVTGTSSILCDTDVFT
jgi:hypothetical protein